MANLIVGGTLTYPPLHNVLCALRLENVEIDGVWLIDTPQTVSKTAEMMEQVKATLGKRTVLVASLEVNENNASERIPDFMAQFVARDTSQLHDLVVDLTTGPKYVTSLLYAAANFCRLNRVYYFLLKARKQDVPFEELTSDDYEYLRLPPFSDKSLAALGRRNHLELIYYLKDVEDLHASFLEHSERLAAEIDRDLRVAVQNYFDGNYRGTVRSIGSLAETWTARLHSIWQENGLLARWPKQKQGSAGKKNDWAGNIEDLEPFLMHLLKVRAGSSVNGLSTEDLALALPLATLDPLLTTVRTYRNIAAHKADSLYEITRDDAKLVLEIGLLLVRKCRDAGFLLGYNQP